MTIYPSHLTRCNVRLNQDENKLHVVNKLDPQRDNDIVTGGNNFTEECKGSRDITKPIAKTHLCEETNSENLSVRKLSDLI